jgi:acyl-coenzyme A thioesterase PaaI-like protein
MSRALESPGARIARAWRLLSPLPMGRTVFSWLIGRMAPYTATVGARAEILAPGHAQWVLRDRRAVRNHLRSIHAVALVNLAEVTSGTAMLVSLPPTLRAIVRGLSITYEKKARGTLVAECRCTIPDVTTPVEHDLHTEIRDEAGDVVARAVVTWLISPRPDDG